MSQNPNPPGSSSSDGLSPDSPREEKWERKQFAQRTPRLVLDELAVESARRRANLSLSRHTEVAVEPARRRSNLSFSHHAEAAQPSRGAHRQTGR
jgi:hypothetical protein